MSGSRPLVIDPRLAVVEVNNFLYATSQLAQTTLRSVLGEAELDELLSEREKLVDASEDVFWPHAIGGQCYSYCPRARERGGARGVSTASQARLIPGLWARHYGPDGSGCQPGLSAGRSAGTEGKIELRAVLIGC